MDAGRRSICELTLTSDRLQSKVENRLLISGVSLFINSNVIIVKCQLSRVVSGTK
jgi:hypothetical protein